MLKVRHKNKYLFDLKKGIRRILYSHEPVLKGYLKAKEIFIKRNSLPYDKDALFEKIFIETVSQCNNDCGFCPVPSKGEGSPEGRFMTEGLFAKIMNELAGLSFKGSVAFYCNNEPLMDRRLPFWVKEAREKLHNNFFYLYTNGTLISLEGANQLFETGLNRIIIDNYDDEHRLIPPVQDLMDHAASLKGEVILDYRHKNDYLGNRAGQNPNPGVVLKEPLRLRCVRPSRELVVGYDGTVPLCCADGLWKVRMGNVQETGLKDIWFSGHFKDVRRILWEADRSVTEICRVCDAVNLSCPKGARI
ncbi:MAG: SPASM domain-containing protein [Candidatus Omnitrophica bacterium]|nr:SPASM domain-containing protein [Candidatus Omnitrophota bacterium]